MGSMTLHIRRVTGAHASPTKLSRSAACACVQVYYMCVHAGLLDVHWAYMSSARECTTNYHL